MLQGCSQSIDARQTQTINGLLYKLNADDPFTGKVTNYPLSVAGIFDLGSCELEVKKGILDGEMQCVSSAGKKVSYNEYKDGKKDGHEKRWSAATGNLISESEWSEGRHNGVEKTFNPDSGKTTAEIHWKNGLKVGSQKGWDASGANLLVDLDWKDGKKTGFVKPGDEGGYEENFKDGQYDGDRLFHVLHGGNELYVSIKEHYVDGKLDGKRQEIDERGRVQVEEDYTNGVIQSRRIDKWQGDTHREVLFKVNAIGSTDRYEASDKMVKDGKEERWDEFGHLQWDIEWNKGKLVKGVYQEWRSGVMTAQFSGVANDDGSELVYNGEEKKFDDSGNLVYNKMWDHGAMTGGVERIRVGDQIVDNALTPQPASLGAGRFPYMEPRGN